MADDMFEHAADGTPIGSINAAPNGDDNHVVCAPATFDENTGLVRRMELVMSPDAALGKPTDEMPVEVIEKVLPGYSDNDKKLRAVVLYVDGDKSLVEIAKELKVPERTVVRWAEEGNWLQFNERMVKTLKEHEKSRLAVKRVKEREKAIDEQIELGHKIADAGKRFVDDAETPGQFKMAAEGVKLGADMVGRALAISETGKVDADAARAGGEDGGAKPLVMVFRTDGGLPPMPKAGEVIDV